MTDDAVFDTAALAAALAQALRDEREACAKIAEDLEGKLSGDEYYWPAKIAAAIRARQP